ncbi:MAG: hypothetical protein ACRDZO_22150 [Egibacteraceae bacterium]
MALERYFASAPTVTAASAWQHVYRLLLWIDPTTGLAHCYESDKSQPGRPWYARSLAFHSWVADQLGSQPATLSDEIDWLFTTAAEDLATSAARILEARTILAAEQRASYAGQDIPEPGQDPELAQLVLDALADYLSDSPPPAVLRNLVQRIRAYVGQENKRKNLLGEGFEDVLASILIRVPGITGNVRARSPLGELPGFYTPPVGAKAERVDLSIVQPSGRRIIVSAKWSIRADRERQFVVDFSNYVRLNAAAIPFEYVLVTNEFDPARLKRNCEAQAQNAPLFTQVVHVNPQAVMAAYGDRLRSGARATVEHIRSGRLMSLQTWLEHLAAGTIPRLR